MLYVDYQLLRRYFENPDGLGAGRHVGRRRQSQAVEGHPNPANAITFNTAIASSGDPSRSCPGVPADQVYDPQSNPKGVRCSFHDYMVNVFGRRPQDGFAGRPADNVGVEYGRKALEDGVITPAAVRRPEREARRLGHRLQRHRRAHGRRPPGTRVRVPQRRGQPGATSWTRSPSSTCAAPTPAPSTTCTAPTSCAPGSTASTAPHANQILWRGQVAIFGDNDFPDEAIVAMDEWLAAVEKDKRDVPLAQKIIEDKPADARRPLHRRPARRQRPARRRVRRDRAGVLDRRASRPGCH